MLALFRGVLYTLVSGKTAIQQAMGMGLWVSIKESIVEFYLFTHSSRKTENLLTWIFPAYLAVSVADMMG